MFRWHLPGHEAGAGRFLLHHQLPHLCPRLRGLEARKGPAHGCGDPPGPDGPRCVKLRDVQQGDMVVRGHAGIRVIREFKDRERRDFTFMASEVSSSGASKSSCGSLRR